MRNLKRVLSLALALVMVLGMMVITTSAADFTDAEEITYSEAVDVMSAIGVINGYEAADGTFTFNPTGNLTREQGAKIVCYLLMGEANAEKLVGSGNFTDVAATRWSAGAIDYCASLGILDGNGDGTFNPTGELTAVMFGKMLLCALGYDADVEGYVGKNWAVNIASDMVDIGLDVYGVEMDAQLTREQAAQMALQALECDMVEYEDKGSSITVGGVEIVTGAKAAEPSDKEAKDYLGNVIEYNSVNDDTLQLVEKYYPGLAMVTGDPDVYGRPAYYKWTLYGDDVHNVLKSATHTFTVKKPASVTNGATLSAAINEALNITKASKKLVYSVGDQTFVNGDLCSSWSQASLQKGDVVEVFVTYGTTDITDVVITRESAAQIVRVTPNTGKATVTIRGEQVVYDYNIFIDTAADGNLDGASDVQLTDLTMPDYTADYVKDTYLTVTLKSGVIVDSAIATPVTGAITSITDTKDVTIAGTKYDMANTTIPGNSTVVDFTEGEYALVMSSTGYVLAVETINAGTLVSLENVVFANGVKWEETSSSYGVTVKEVYTQVVGMDGTVSDILVGGWNIEADGSTVSHNFGIVDATGTASAIVPGLYMVEDVDANRPAGLPAHKNLNGTCTITAAPGTSYAFGTISNTGLTLKDTDKKLDNKYITDTTVYLQVKGDSANIKTTVATGGLSYVTTAAPDPAAETIYTVTKTANGNVQIVAVVIDGSTLTTTAADMLYIKSATTTENAKGYEQTVYDMAGNKTTITVKNGDQSVVGFVTYSIDDKGVYDVTAAAGSLAADADWNKNVLKLENIKYVESFYADCINVTDGTYTMADIPAENIVVVDLRVTPVEKNGYQAAIGSVADMQAAMQTYYNGGTSYYYAVEGDIYVSMTGAVIFFVTGTVQGASV